MKEEKRDIFISGLAILMLWYFSKENFLLIIAVVYPLLGWFSPFFGKLNHQFWKKITKLLQLVMNPILMGIIFFFVLTPLSWLFRFLKKKKEKTGTTFDRVEKSNSIADFEKGW